MRAPGPTSPLESGERDPCNLTPTSTKTNIRTVLRKSTNVRSGCVPTVGVIGGGQLARMMVPAAVALGCRLKILSGEPDVSASGFAELVTGDWRDPCVTTRFAQDCDVITFEHELVPDDVYPALERSGVPTLPLPTTMRNASNKVIQRELARAAGLQVAGHEVVSDAAELANAVDRFGLPLVAKRISGGYDGRGLTWLRSADDIDRMGASLAGDPVLIEPELSIDAELAVTVARRRNGEHLTYPVVRTFQEDGICRSVIAPARIHPHHARSLTAAAVTIADQLDHVGVITVEAFLVDDELYLNELAPRPHNSAHYTIDACTTSQFENHLRAVLDLPLGDASMVVPAAAMANVIAAGEQAVWPSDVELPPRTSIHLYAKRYRPGRKVGHVTVTGHDPTAIERIATAIADKLSSPGERSDDPVGSPKGASA